MTSEKVSQAKLLPRNAPSHPCLQKSSSCSDETCRVIIAPFRTITAKYLLGVMSYVMNEEAMVQQMHQMEDLIQARSNPVIHSTVQIRNRGTSKWFLSHFFDY